MNRLNTAMIKHYQATILKHFPLFILFSFFFCYIGILLSQINWSKHDCRLFSLFLLLLLSRSCHIHLQLNTISTVLPITSITHKRNTTFSHFFLLRKRFTFWVCYQTGTKLGFINFSNLQTISNRVYRCHNHFKTFYWSHKNVST